MHVIHVAVKPVDISRQDCALAAVTIAAENAHAAGCMALIEAGERG